jgi:D-amino-acid dehydrogenase
MPAKGGVMQIIVVGAGVFGASTAFHLAAKGTQVTVIDAGLDGRATAAGAGIICPWVSGTDDLAFYRLCAAGGAYYPDLIDTLRRAGEADTGYRRAGAMVVSADPAELDGVERLVRRRAALAEGDFRRLSPAEAQARFPPLRSGLGGVLIERGARVDGRRLAAALLRAAVACGARIVQGHATVLVEADRVVGVAVAGEQFAADRVVVTAGAWTDQVLRPLGQTVSVEPQRGQIVHLRLEQAQTADWPVILPPGSHYIVPFEDGRIVAGATRETGSGFDYRVTAAGQSEVLTEALAVAPGLATATLLQTRVGFRPVGAEVRPCLGWVGDVEGLAVGTGLGASGLTMGPFAGRLLADLVAGQPGVIDLEPFDPMLRAGGAGPFRPLHQPPVRPTQAISHRGGQQWM